MRTACTILLATACTVAAADTVELVGGHTVQGDILKRSPDRLVIDLGFTVLDVPTDAVVAVTGRESDSSSGPVTIEHGDLYRLETGRERLTVRENMARCAEAVVQVRTPTSLGSGFVVHPDGWVVTNNHVISGEHELTVTVFESAAEGLVTTRFDRIRIVAMSPDLDLALLKIEPDTPREFASVPLGRSQELRQGQVVFAVGSPLGLDRSVSQGIVSLTHRVIRGNLMIQTTTQINPGNSGGPLFNLRGEVVGVSDLKLVGVGLEGLNFAIPADTVRSFLDNRSAWAFDPRNPNAGFRYPAPPRAATTVKDGAQ